MKTKRNNKYFKQTKRTKYNFFVGDVPRELKKLRGFFNRATRSKGLPENIDIHVSRQICCQIPANQDQLAAEARGEKFERAIYTPYLNVRVQ